MLKYLVTYIIMFVLWSVFVAGDIEQGYEKLHWMAIAVVSLLSLLPVAIYDILKRLGL